MIDKILSRYCWVLGLLGLLPSLAQAQRDWVFVGPRAVGMGSAYLAVANNAEAVYWNPAALARMEHFHFTLAYGDFYKVNFKSYYASTVFDFPLGRRLADYFTFGLDWLGLQDSSQSLSNITDDFHAALGIKPFKSVPTLSLGVSANVRRLEEWNVGALYSLPIVPFQSWGRFSLGVMFHNPYGTPEKRPIDNKNKLKDHRFRYGLSCQFFKGLGPIAMPLLAIDYGERLHQGFELTIKMSPVTASIRFGIQKDLKNREKMTHSLGITLNFDFDGKQPQKQVKAFQQVEAATAAMGTSRCEINYHYARTNSPEWNSSYQYGVSAVIPTTSIPAPAPDPPGICPSSIQLNWHGSSEKYEDGYIILRKQEQSPSGFWFIKGLGWRESNYCDLGLKPGTYYSYQLVAYKENIDAGTTRPLMISEAAQINNCRTTEVSWLCNLVVTYKSKSIYLTFGKAETASNNLDSIFCEHQLGAAQANRFDARFILDHGTSQSLTDIRPTATTPDTWKILLQPDSDKEDFELTWDPNTLPSKTTAQIKLIIHYDTNPRTPITILMNDSTNHYIIGKAKNVSDLTIVFNYITSGN